MGIHHHSFNPRPREGSDLTVASDATLSGDGFNPRPREGSDHAVRVTWAHITPFQSAPPRRERCCPCGVFVVRVWFQSTPPRRERYPFQSPCSPQSYRFNPRPREGSDGLSWFSLVAASMFQSAPPRRERYVAGISPRTREVVSIRAPAKGAINPRQLHSPVQHCFNPRPREGSDSTISLADGNPGQVSIRAPAKGAICSPTSTTRQHKSFNPRPREGSDPRNPSYTPG